MIQTIQLQPQVRLHYYPDRRFHQGCLSLQFLSPMARQTGALNALIPAILLRGTEAHPDLRSITQRLDELYGASVGTLVRRVGDYQTTGLYCGFIEDRFALPGDRVLEPMVDFLQELLLSPKLTAGAFDPDFVESEKKNLIATIESERNDKRAYAMGQLLRAMCREDSFGIPRLGDPQTVAAITPSSAWDRYQKLLRESPVELFYVGSAPLEQVAAMLGRLLDRIPGNRSPLPEQTPFRDAGGGEHEERMDVSQGKLCLGYTTSITNRSPEFAAMQVFNAIFGAGMTSKLFVNVREKLSLCYSIGSGYYGSKGIVTVHGGIDFDQKDRTWDQIQVQLQACCQGQITDGELTAGKEAILSSLRGIHDAPGSIEGYYATNFLSGAVREPEAYMAQVAAVTAEDVAAAARTLVYHTGYFLKGDRA